MATGTAVDSGATCEVPDVEIDLRCVETLSDCEDNTENTLYGDNGNDGGKDIEAVAGPWCHPTCEENRHLNCDRCARKRKMLLKSFQSDSQDSDDSKDELTKIKPKGKKSKEEGDNQSKTLTAEESEDAHKVPEISSDDSQKGNSSSQSERQSQSTTDGEDDDASTVLSQLSISDDSPGPSQPERLLDSCYIGDHFVPFLEE